MRVAPILFLLLVLTGTGCNKNVNKQVRDAVRNFDNLELTDEEIEVLSTQELAGSAVAEVKIRTAVKLIKKDGRWVIDEIRLGDRRWEKADHVRAVLNSQRSQTTTRLMESVAAGIEKYAGARGEVPQSAGFEDLVSALSPGFLESSAQLDAWSNPLHYRTLGKSDYEIRSAGADGKTGTADDLVFRRSAASKE